MTGTAGPSPWVLTIVAEATFPGAAGGEAMALIVPGRWYGDVAGRRALLARVVHRELRALSEAGAARVGERLHHADWVITGDPAQVRQVLRGGSVPHCPQCEASEAAALDWLLLHPGGEVAAGMLHWLAPPPESAERPGA